MYTRSDIVCMWSLGACLSGVSGVLCVVYNADNGVWYAVAEIQQKRSITTSK